MRHIANFTVEDEPIARGGMGQVFRGHDNKGNAVAIKEILPEFATDWTIMSRIEKEVEFLVKMEHPSIVKLYSAFRDDNSQSYYIIMEMVDGMNLEQYVSRKGALPEEKAVEIMLKVLDALQCVHNANIVHRDLKPSNIMIRDDGRVCLLDFGVAKDMDYGGNTIAGSIIGTSGYMSPEQAEGYSINKLSDIYSLGCVFFYMLTGHHAFNTLASDFETIDAIITQEFPKLSKYNKNVNPTIQKILDKATARNMMQRYQSCYEFIAALNSGTHVSHRGIGRISVMLTVGREKCDITISDKECKISRHHADIELKEFTGGKYYVFIDCSANGSIVNGKLVKRSSVSIPSNGNSPKILLAGVQDGVLDWKKVVEELDKRAKALDSTETSSIQPDALEQKIADVEDETSLYIEKDATGWLIAAFTFAVLGGLLGLVFGLTVYNSKIQYTDGRKVPKYKKDHRTLGLAAAVLSCISFILCYIVAML